MNFQRIWTLTKLDVKNMFFSVSSLYLYIPFGITIIADLGIGWNDQSLTLFTIPIESCCDSKEKAVLEILHEHFSWVWLFVAFSHLLPQLLSRLQDSFLVSQSLWLRFTPCLPYEVAISRALKVILYGVWIATLGIIWGLLNAVLHQVSFRSLLLDILGIFSYVLMSGGVVTVFDFGLSLGYTGRRLISTIALFIPVLCLMIFIIVKDSMYSNNFPYAVPFLTSSESFNEVSGGVQNHFIMAAIVGFLLLLVHVGSKMPYFRVEIDAEVEEV